MSPPAILVVDDELTLLAVLRELLEAEGMVVHEAANALAAFEVMQRHPEIELVVTDIAMPGTGDGRELTRFIRRSRPDLPLLLMSGRTIEPLEDCGNVVMLRKPFVLDDFVMKVKELLADAGKASLEVPSEHGPA
jgi:CheY-like chemotaxis protein